MPTDVPLGPSCKHNRNPTRDPAAELFLLPPESKFRVVAGHVAKARFAIPRKERVGPSTTTEARERLLR